MESTLLPGRHIEVVSQLIHFMQCGGGGKLSKSNVSRDASRLITVPESEKVTGI